MSALPILDLRGLKCPLPVLRTRKAMRALAPGAALLVLATDPLATLDIAHMAREDGHALLGRWPEGEAVAFHLVKGAAPQLANSNMTTERPVTS